MIIFSNSLRKGIVKVKYGNVGIRLETGNENC
jgi:hypothetical protein